MSEAFDVVNFDDFEEEIPLANSVSNGLSKVCFECNNTLIQDPIKQILLCNKCGAVERLFDQQLSNSVKMLNYNSLESSAWTVRVYGKNSYKNNRHLCSSNLDYKKIQRYNTWKQLDQINSNSTVGKFSRSILNETADLFYKIQRNSTKKIVRRGNGRRGLLGACLGDVLTRNNIARKPREIAQYIQVDESYISKADKTLQMLHYAKEIELVIEKDEIGSYINRYFITLKIDNKYLPFCKQIVQISEESTDLKGENNSRISTKTAGVVYILTSQIDMGITHLDISKKCNISYPTFIRFSKFIERNKLFFKDIFEKYGVPLFTIKKKIKKNKNKIKKQKNKPL